MGYLDYAGLQHLWDKLKEKFAPKSHSHDDRYYTESEMDGKLNSKSNTNHTHDASTLINALGAGTAAPTDPDYIITQWVGGGTSNTTWIRRPMSSIWNYIKGKADGVYQPKGSYAASGHTHDDRYYTEAEVDGKLTEKLHEETITDARDLNTIKTTGVYHLKTTSYTNGPGISNHATIFVDYTVGTPYQIFITDSVNRAWRRNHVNSNDTWSAWTELKYTDTNTWRGIQNNLTSDSTSDSLSAAQGKVLKGLIDGKAPNGHTHNSIKDIGNNSSNTTFAYSKSGMNYGDYTWLAGWNGYELRAVNKSQFAVAGHTHSFINSVGVKNAQTGRNQIYGDVYSYNSNASANTGMPTTYTSTIGFGQGSAGTVEICGEWTGGKGLWSRALRDYQDNWYDWQRIYTENYHPNADHATSADSATTSNGVKDYNDANRTIKIGYIGEGLNTSNLTHIAGYTDNGTKIKDVSKDVLKSWIGLGNYLPLGGGTMTGQITKSTGGSWIGDRDRAAIKSSYAGDSSYGAVAAMATKNGYWTMGNLGGNESLIFNYSTDSNYNAGNNSTSQVYLPAQAGTIITSATIGNQTVNRAEYLANDSAYMRMHWSGQSGQPSWLWGGNDASNMYVYNPSNFSVNYATAAGNGVYSSSIVIASGYIRFNCGVQICWGISTSTSDRGSFTFPQNFVYDPCIVISGTGAYRYAFYITKTSSTSFSYYRDGSGSTVSPQYVAFGRWK